MDTDLLAAAAVTTTIVACMAAGNTHYRPSANRTMAVTATGKTSCALK